MVPGPSDLRHWRASSDTIRRAIVGLSMPGTELEERVTSPRHSAGVIPFFLWKVPNPWGP